MRDTFFAALAVIVLFTLPFWAPGCSRLQLRHILADTACPAACVEVAPPCADLCTRAPSGGEQVCLAVCESGIVDGLTCEEICVDALAAAVERVR